MPYQTEFSIRPLLQKSTFELFGFIKTELPEDCSRCGLDFKLVISEKFRGLLMPELEQPRNAKYAKTNHVSDAHEDGPAVIEYGGNQFHSGDYLHEIIAMAIPFTPSPAEDKSGNCSLCGKDVRTSSFGYEDKGVLQPANPFAALKDLKPKI